VTGPPDVVVPVRLGERNEELRHALRSVAANLPHGRVWLAGHMPTWVRGCGHVPSPQGGTKHMNTWRSIAAACEDRRVSEEFVLWNDDFYLMRPLGGPPPVLHRGTVREYLEGLPQNVRRSAYHRGLAATAEILIRLGVPDPLCYELHVPMPMTKSGLLAARRAALAPGMPPSQALQPRTLVGNLSGLGGERAEDVKVCSPHDPPPPPTWDPRFLSSGDASWGRHPALRAVEEAFPEPCRYEAEAAEREGAA
jgi:hypothetical protein